MIEPNNNTTTTTTIRRNEISLKTTTIVIPLIIIMFNFVIFHNFQISFIILFIMGELFIYTLIIGIFFQIKEWWLNRHRRRNMNYGTNMDLDYIQNILNNYKIIYNENDECVICLEILEYSIVLKCNHVFHRHCLDQ